MPDKRTTVSFSIPGPPIGKARARITRSGRSYTPKKTADYEKRIRSLALVAMAGRKLFRCPLSLGLSIVYPIPASWPQWKSSLALDGEILPTVTPDIDNIEKAVQDAMQGVVFANDSQFVSGSKVAAYGRHPAVWVWVHPYDKHPAQISKKPQEAK